MKALVLGAAGVVGRAAASTLVRRGRFECVTVSDLRADRLAEGPATDVLQLDVTDGGALRSAIEKVDVVLNCTTYHFGFDVLTAAIDARTSYVDLGGLHNTPRQLALHEDAAGAGVIAVLGCGATPGVSNVLAALALRDLGDVRDVEISFVSYRDLAASPGLLDTILDEFRPETERYFWADGSFVNVEPFSGSKVVLFPEPVGEATVFYVPHSENHTLPRSIPNLSSVAVRGTWRSQDMDLLRTLAAAGMTSSSEIPLDGGRVRPLDVLKAVLLKEHRPSGEPCCFFLNVSVWAHDGRHVEYLVSHPLEWGADATGAMTGIPAAIAAEMIGAGAVERAGVNAPETAFDPEAFLSALAGEAIAIRRAEVPAAG